MKLIASLSNPNGKESMYKNNWQETALDRIVISISLHR